MSPHVALLVALLLVCGVVAQETSTEWDCFHYGYAEYNGPFKWRNFCPNCRGCLQSPIFIDRDAVSADPDVKLEGSFFDVERFYETDKYFLLENDGHGVNLKLVDTDEVCIQGTNLDGVYCLDHVQFKWGSDDEDGTEHQFDFSSLYAMERQWAFYSKRYESYEEALNHEGGVAMMGQPMLRTTLDAPTMFDPIVKLLPHVREPGQVKRSDEPLPYHWLQPDLLQKTIFYNGTLTAPPCTKGVLWMLFAPEGYINSNELAEFRKLMSADGPLLDNRRTLTFANNRPVWSQDNLWVLQQHIWPFIDYDVASGQTQVQRRVATSAQQRTSRKLHKRN